MKRTHRRAPARLFLKGKSTRARRNLLAVFVLIFGAGAPGARAACVEFVAGGLGTISLATPRFVAADIDSDGDLDLLSASGLGNDVAWLESDGEGGGWTAHTIANPFFGGYSAAAADLDGDGDLDAAIGSVVDQRLSWFANDGAGGGWIEHAISSVTTGWNPIVPADLDADGDLDLVVASQSDDVVRWFENDGSGGGWAEHTVVSGINNPGLIATGDVDRDGDLDIATTFASVSRVAWFANDGAGGGWAAHTISITAVGAHGVALGDLDRDGDLDAASASTNDDKIAWYRNLAPGDGSSWTLITVSTSADFARTVDMVDVDRDGDLDLAATSSGDGELSWFENRDGTGGAFAAHPLLNAAINLASAVAADLDRDGDLDFAAASGESSMLRNGALHGAALFGDVRSISTLVVLARTVVAGDMDRDGDLDPGLVNGNDSSIDFFRNDSGASAWTWKQFTGFLEGGSDAALVDLDGDGDLDAVGASDYIGALLWFGNEGGFGSSNFNIDLALTDPAAVATGDFDGLGRPDVAVGDSTLGAVLWYANDGTPTTGAWTRLTVATNLGSLADLVAADLDSDGDLDLVAARTVAGSGIVWLESDGAANPAWTRRTLLTTPGKAAHLVAGDVDGDGDLDLTATVTDSATPNLVWLENDATPTVGAWTLHTTALVPGTTMTDLAGADLDRDGDFDFALSALGAVSDPVLVFANDGAGLFAVSTAALVDTPTAVAAADLDRDGDLDLAVGTSTALVWVPNLGTRIHDDGFDSDANTTCWSTTVP